MIDRQTDRQTDDARFCVTSYLQADKIAMLLLLILLMLIKELILIRMSWYIQIIKLFLSNRRLEQESLAIVSKVFRFSH